MDTQNVAPPTQPLEPVISPPKQKSPIILIIIIFLLLIVIGAGAYYLGTRQAKTQNNVIPTPILYPTQTVTIPDETENWSTYINKTYNYFFKYPEDWEVFRQTNDDTVISIRPKGVENIPITLSAHINNGNLTADMIINNQVGENYPKQIKTFNNIGWTYFNNKISPYESNSYITVKGPNYYEADVSTLLNNKYISTFEKILSTFKFLDQETTDYICPENGWVNCMPILTEEGKKACSAEAIAWYKTNCSNFKGIAQ